MIPIITPEENKGPADDHCPLCGEKGRWKLSGRGKHYGLICEEHGFIRIIRNPLLGPPRPRLNVFQRFVCVLFNIYG
jgi:hypothetical protein